MIPGLRRSSGEGMATYFNILSWRIPWTEEPGELQSKGSQRVVRTRPSDYTLPFKELKMFSFSKHPPPTFSFSAHKYKGENFIDSDE